MPSDAAIAAFKSSLRGELIQPSDSNYNEARKIYNAMHDKKPRLIAIVADVADVITAVKFARAEKMLVAIQGGGHNAGGLGSVDDGLVIKLSRMNGIRVDLDARTVRVEGGCTWGDVDHATHAFGFAVPSGIISTTGVGGLTLGGGIGHLTRGCGLTIDNLLEADVVLADGRLVTASAEEESGSLLGAARRRRQLRRRDVVPVPHASGPHRLRGPDAVRVERGRRRHEVVPQVHHEGAEGADGLLHVPDRAARTAVPGAPAHEEDVRHRVVLLRAAQERREDLQADSRVQEAGARSRRADSASRVEQHVRRALPAGTELVLEGGLREGAERRGDRAPRQARIGSADVAVDDAPVSDRRRGVEGEDRTRPPGATATRAGPRSSSASIRIRRARSR